MVVSSNPLVDTVKSNDSDKTLSGSSDSIGTAYRLDSQDSTTSVEGRTSVRTLLPVWKVGHQSGLEGRTSHQSCLMQAVLLQFTDGWQI